MDDVPGHWFVEAMKIGAPPENAESAIAEFEARLKEGATHFILAVDLVLVDRLISPFFCDDAARFRPRELG